MASNNSNSNNNSGSNFVHLDVSAFTGVFNQAIHEALARQQFTSTTPSGTAGTPSGTAGTRHANPRTVSTPSTTNSSDENKRLVCLKLLCLH